MKKYRIFPASFVGRAVQQLWKKVVDLLERASRQTHVVALRDGMIGAVPIILVGSTFLLLGAQSQMLTDYMPTLAASSLGKLYLANVQTILLPYRFTMGLLSLYVAFTIACSLAKEYELPIVPNGLTALAALLLTGGMERDPERGWILALKPLGAEGLFLAIFLGVATVEISRQLTFIPKDTGKESSGGVPPAVVHAFASFLPMLTCVSVIWLVRHVAGYDIHHFILEQTAFLKQLGDSFGAVLIVNTLLHLFGVAGVHGISVINAGMLPIWQEFVAANAAAHEAGQALPYMTAYPFYQWFIWIGGAGATLAPTVRCMLSKNAHVRKIGRISIIPAMFNVNEPLLFGLPVVANPLLAIPFILAPLACGTIAYFATAWDMVGRAFIEVPWVMPCFLGSVLSTQDWRAFVLLMVNLVVSYVIWAPFISGYERRLERDADAAPKTPETEVEVEPAEPHEGEPEPVA